MQTIGAPAPVQANASRIGQQNAVQYVFQT